ncbi:MAG: polyphenol oxidase family protein [Candidatus Krumholzibacteriia bacterium]
MSPDRDPGASASASGDRDDAGLGPALVALARELQGGGDLLAAGLRERRHAAPTTHPVLTCLAAGCERLLKAVVCLAEQRRTGRFPGRGIFPSGHRGHALVGLAQRLTAAAGDDPRPQAVAAGRLLASVPAIGLLECLSGYAQAARYHDLDLVLGHASRGGAPQRHWEAFLERLNAAQSSDGVAGADPLDRLVRRLAGALLQLAELWWPAGAPVPSPTTVALLASTPAFVLARDASGRLSGRFPALDAVPGLVHVVTTRGEPEFGREASGATMRAAAADTASVLGLTGAAWAHQVHGGRVIEADTAGLAGDGDAVWTAQTDLGVLARSADCPLILVAALPEETSGAPLPATGRAAPVAVAHASWRSTGAGIAPALVRELAAAGADPAGLVCAIAPSAGPCCYEVGEDVRHALRASHGDAADAWLQRSGSGRLHLDLWLANRDQLAAAGVRPQNIHVAGICTICHPDLFPSHRAEAGRAGRFAAVIGRSA